MGLDWCLIKTKPKEGFEDRFKVVTEMLSQMRQDEAIASPQLEAELKEISVSCYEAVGAPQVGHDERANEWFREKCYDPAHKDAVAGKMHHEEQARYWGRSFEECLEDNKGRYVMELAQQEGGIASVSGMVMVTNIDFRGKILRFCEGLPEELINEAYEDHEAEESLHYANRLEIAMPKVKEKHREDLQGAINWLRFWGERGFGWWAWY